MDFPPCSCYGDDMTPSPEEKQRRYVELVGEKLRRLRLDRGMSLQEVCDRSGGSFVVSTLSAYERGKRSLSLERLLELAEIYGLSPTSLLEVEQDGERNELSRNAPLRIHMSKLDRLTDDERRPLENYLAFLRNLRNDPSRDILTIRKDDLAYLSGLYGMRPQLLKERLEAEGIIE
jgi:transcriptional regulator with XRE-family HTH domain